MKILYDNVCIWLDKLKVRRLNQSPKKTVAEMKHSAKPGGEKAEPLKLKKLLSGDQDTGRAFLVFDS